ncbi:hypothetical protein ACJX0J_035951, partial [Zea mays]
TLSQHKLSEGDTTIQNTNVFLETLGDALHQDIYEIQRKKILKIPFRKTCSCTHMLIVIFLLYRRNIGDALHPYESQRFSNSLAEMTSLEEVIHVYM